MRKTENFVSKVDIIKHNLSFGVRIRLNFILDNLRLFTSSAKVQRAIWMAEQYRQNEAKMLQSTLSPETVIEFSNYNSQRVHGTMRRKLRDQAVDDERIKNCGNYGFVQKGAWLLSNVLRENRKSIKSAVNIGARIDPVFGYFSGIYPDMRFKSIDMQGTLLESNEGLPKRDNWELVNGYALKLFESGDVDADLVFMTSTTPKFTNAEMKRYMAAFKKCGVKVIVLNEPWWVFPLSWRFFSMPLPEDLSSDRSELGGFLADYQHNYWAMADFADYKVVLSRMFKGMQSSGGWCDQLQVVMIAAGELENIAFEDRFGYRPGQ